MVSGKHSFNVSIGKYFLFIRFSCNIQLHINGDRKFQGLFTTYRALPDLNEFLLKIQKQKLLRLSYNSCSLPVVKIQLNQYSIFGPCCLFLHVQAAVKALETAKDLGHKTLEIKTDSRYTINGKDQIYAAYCFFFSCQQIFATVEWLNALGSRVFKKGRHDFPAYFD